GGSSDTELNEFAVIPSSSPSGPLAVTIVIPVQKLPSALRNSILSIVIAAALTSLAASLVLLKARYGRHFACCHPEIRDAVSRCRMPRKRALDRSTGGRRLR